MSAAMEPGWIVVRNTGGFRTEITAGAHAMVADEPATVGGTDAGPTPYDYLLAAIGGCTAMTVRMYAMRKSWPLDEVVVRMKQGRSHEADCERCETMPVGIDHIDRQVELIGALTDEQRTKLLSIADRCPVKQAIGRGIEVHGLI
ncbi:MAG: OsmC family protein [Gemmatimonadaceae bacterium]